MSPWLNHPLRVTGRLCRIGGELGLASIHYGIHCAFCNLEALPAARARWMQRVSRRLLQALRVDIQSRGVLPSTGLLVCNHLSYLDILVVAALTPCVFVAKQEVKSWPVFGWFAAMAGTVFVHREKRAQTGAAVAHIESTLQAGSLVVLFPEGTSSDGRTVLPFKSSLLEPVAGTMHSVSVGLIQYELSDGDVGEEVCYWKDMTLVPHLINLCSKRTVRALVRFNRARSEKTDRKQMARDLHTEVLRMKHAGDAS